MLSVGIDQIGEEMLDESEFDDWLRELDDAVNNAVGLAALADVRDLARRMGAAAELAGYESVEFRVRELLVNVMLWYRAERPAGSTLEEFTGEDFDAAEFALSGRSGRLTQADLDQFLGTEHQL